MVFFWWNTNINKEIKIMGFGLFDLLTWPVILLGLLRGSYFSYKCVQENSDDKTKYQQLQYWVVFCAIIFFFSHGLMQY